MIAPQLNPRTVFFGGGTPSLLPLKHLDQILGTFHDQGWNHLTEWTVECNPATVSKEKAEMLKQAGVNRISMGVQSLDTDLLNRLGRIHSREQVFRSYDTFRAAGIENINLDLMFAIPTQSSVQWQATLDEICAMESDHLSCYEVIYEEDTALYQQLKAGEFDVDDELANKMYETLLEHAGNNGFKQYEIANFARSQPNDDLNRYPSRAALHNINYWEGGDYYGVGPAATEWIEGRRRKHWSNTQLYCDQVEKGARGIEFEEHLSIEARMGESAAFALRMSAGIDLDRFEERFGVRAEKYWEREMDRTQSLGLGELTQKTFRLTQTGLRFADSVGAEFVHTES
jgi:oxygen-independent coproporphyrinogen III oxidase